MAVEKVRAIKIDTGDSVKSINQLKQEIEDLKAKLNDSNLSQEEAKKLSDQLVNAQDRLASSMGRAKETSQKLDQTYTTLQTKLTQLKKEYQNTTDSIRQTDLSGQIASITTQMNALEGQTQRTAGTMAGFGNAMSQLGGSGCSMLVSGMNNIGAAMTMLEAHPLIAIVAVAAAVLLKIVNAIKQNEVAMEAFGMAMAPLKGLLDEVNTLFTKLLVKIADFVGMLTGQLAQGIQWLAEKMASLARTFHMDSVADELDTVVAKMKEGARIAQEERDIKENTRRINQENVDLQVKLAELQAEQAKYNQASNEYRELGVQIEEVKAEIAKRNLELARQEYELIKAQNAQHVASQSELDKETQAYVKMKQAEAEVINTSTDRYKATFEQTKALEGSYNALANELAVLKARWQATNDEAERDSLTKQINKIDRQLAKLDFSIGDFSKRAGDYRYALEALGSQGAGAIVGGVRMVNTALKTLAANPIFAIIAVVAAIITGIVKAIQKNERAVRKLQQAMAPLKGLFNVIQNALDWITDKLVNGLTKAIEGVTKMFRWFAKSIGDVAGKLGLESVQKKMYGILDAMDAQNKITERQLAMEAERRKIAEEQAEIEVELAKVRQQFALAEGDRVKQAKLAKRIGELDNAIKQKAYDLAKKEYELIRDRNALTQSTQEDLNAESEARQKMLKAEAALYDVEKEEKKVLKQNAKDREKEATEVEKLIKMLTDWAAKQTESIELSEKAINERFDREYDMLEGNLEAQNLLVLKYQQDLKVAREKKAKKDLTDLNTIYATGTHELSLKYVQLATDIEKAYEQTGDARAYNLALQAKEIQQTKDELAAKDAYIKSLTALYERMKSQGLDTVDIEKQIAAANLERAQLNLQLMEQEHDAVMRLNDEMYEGLAQNLDILSDYASKIASIGDGISSQWASVFSSMQDGLASVQNALKDGGKTWQSYGKIAVAALGVAANTMLALADEQDENTQEGFEQQKKFQIAAIVMNGAAGILNAWLSAMSPENAWMTVWGQIAMGAAMSTLIGTMMGLQLKQVENTQFGGGSSGASSSVTSSLVAPVQYTSEVAGAYTEDVQSDTRVYVLESDITGTQDKVNVAESESRY